MTARKIKTDKKNTPVGELHFGKIVNPNYVAPLTAGALIAENKPVQLKDPKTQIFAEYVELIENEIRDQAKKKRRHAEYETVNEIFGNRVYLVKLMNHFYERGFELTYEKNDIREGRDGNQFGYDYYAKVGTRFTFTITW